MRTLPSQLGLAALASLASLGTLGGVGCLPQEGTGTSGGTTSSSGGTSGSSGSSGSSGTDGGMTAAGKACLDTAAAYATAAKRCGGDYETERTAFIRGLAGGDCNTVAIRNEPELRAQCIPSFGTISCPDLKNQRFVPGCAEQIIR